MSLPAFNPDDEECASDLALDLLEELRLTLVECCLVLKILPPEACLNLRDLEQLLVLAHNDARQAYGAASLLRQGAELDDRWGHNHSRPKAVFARHSAAVHRGAQRIRPIAPFSDHFERYVWQLPEESSVCIRPGSATAGIGESPEIENATSDPAEPRGIVNTCGSACFRRPPFRLADRRLRAVSVG